MSFQRPRAFRSLIMAANVWSEFRAFTLWAKISAYASPRVSFGIVKLDDAHTLFDQAYGHQRAAGNVAATV